MTDLPSPPSPASPRPYALAAAAVLLALYVGLTIAMVVHFAKAPPNSPQWEHALLIYNGFTAFAVAAAGVLLGTQIQQTVVASARNEATQAKAESDRLRAAVRGALSTAEAAPSVDDGGEPSLARVRSVLTGAL
jgi:hypothetical protein